MSQRHQRKIHALRRGQHRLTSCSSEPLSPEDHFSSTASTPTTPYVNAMEEHQDEQHYSETTHEKSFKFPKFKKVCYASILCFRLIRTQYIFGFVLKLLFVIFVLKLFGCFKGASLISLPIGLKSSLSTRDI